MHNTYINLPKVIFIHIPKTAGRSFAEILKMIYGSKRALHAITPWIRSDTRLEDSSFLTEESRIKISTIPKKTKLIYGHIENRNSIFKNFEAQKITFLRDPLERVVSEYNHARTSAGHILFKEINERNISLSEYCLSGYAWSADNMQTRFISGMHSSTRFGEVGKEHLECAKECLENEFIFGFQEDFAESVRKIFEAMNWGVPYYKVAIGVTGVQRWRDALDVRLAGEIERLNKFDIELYKFATNLKK